MSDWLALPDLASERLGGAVEWASDEFFAPKENLLKEEAPVWKEGVYTDRGKWMDGWESQRHRAPDHDSCVVRLGLPGVVRGVVVDTAFFRGNFPERASLEGLADGEWVPLVPESPLQGDHKNLFEVNRAPKVSRVRFHIHPDGGVARLRVHGDVLPDLGLLSRRGEFDLAAIDVGGTVTDASDRFFSSPHHLLLPDRARGMHDGWETRRRRGPGHDWVEVRLAAVSRVDRVDIDTSFFRGNFPTSAALEAKVDGEWREVVGDTRLTAHSVHTVLVDVDGVTDVRLKIFPDGGVARLRVHGAPTWEGWGTMAGAELDSRRDPAGALRDCCGSSAWLAGMTEGPLGDVFAKCDAVFERLTCADLFEAFGSHPDIGAARVNAWSAQEQAGMETAEAGVRARIAELNPAYRERFGHTFLVCASGRSAEEMLGLMERWMTADAGDELAFAAEELRRITRIRIAKAVGFADARWWA
jgi:allantoicase